MRMTVLATWLASMVLLAAAGEALPAPIVLEPDDYADRTVLDTIIPEVSLKTLTSNNWPAFSVTANIDGQHLAPTGEKVFGHANVPFFNNGRRLLMDFTYPVSVVSIAFAGGTFFQTEIGQLEIYDVDDNLLDIYLTAPKGPGEAETMTLMRPQGDIEYAIAYIAEGNGSFGRLDHLVFSAEIPEPSAFMLLGAGAVGLLAFACRRKIVKRSGSRRL